MHSVPYTRGWQAALTPGISWWHLWRKNPCTKKENRIRKTKLFLADKPLVILNCVHFGIRIFSILLCFFFSCSWYGYIISVLVAEHKGFSFKIHIRIVGHLNKQPTPLEKHRDSKKLGSWLIILETKYTVIMVICMKSWFENGLHLLLALPEDIQESRGLYLQHTTALIWSTSQPKAGCTV